MLNISAGSYYGNGYSSASQGGYGGGYNQVITSSKVRSMSRNTGAGYSQQMEIVEKYLKQGNIDKALKKYQSLFDEIKESNTYGNMTINDSQVSTIMANAYMNATGSTLTDDIDKKTMSSFASGFCQGLPLVGLFCSDTTEAEAYAKLDNDKVSAKDKVLEYIGSLTPGAAVAAVGGGMLLAGVATAAAPVVLGAGAVCAAVGAVQTFFKDVL